MLQAQRQREPQLSLALYHLFKWSVVAPLFHAYFRGRIWDAQRVPQRGPLIIVSNHASYFDPPLLSNSVRRPVAFMAKAELFKLPIFSTLIRLYGAYPVQRGSRDRSALRSAHQALKNGWSVGIFLTGTRTQDGRIDQAKLGAALIAAQAQVPLLPVCLWGTEKILAKGIIPQPVPVTVRIGQLIPPPASSNRQDLEAVTQACVTQINALHDLGR